MGNCIVATSGFFDLIHAGHIDFLERAKALGDHLVVFLNSDDSASRLKGSMHPTKRYADREAVLRGLRSVDHVCPFDQNDPCEVLARIRPDLYVKGEEHRAEQIPEESLVRSWGGIMIYLPHTVRASVDDPLVRMGL